MNNEQIKPQNPLTVALSKGRHALIEWSFDWYPGGFEQYEKRFRAIDWESLPDDKANDMTDPAMRIARPGVVDKIRIVSTTYKRKATALTGHDLKALREAECLITAQVDYARLSEIYC